MPNLSVSFSLVAVFAFAFFRKLYVLNHKLNALHTPVFVHADLTKHVNLLTGVEFKTGCAHSKAYRLEMQPIGIEKQF